ncbi:ATP-binding protein [Streptomyces paludis]|uniref:ATP-binding protein n=1 Tax=Streptomyces paludis TaxID=2282738 RepID=UPI001E46F805|nr:ATP-binding protein [Streptomyces paludis]
MQVLQMQLEVGPDPAEVGRARRWARSRLVGSGMDGDEPVAEALILLISELVTNAVVHTGCPAVLRVLFGAGPAEADTVRVEVADASAVPPRPRHAEGDDTNGRGLELVDCLADRWGWQPEGAGKRIWCEIDRTAKAPEAATDTSSTATSSPPTTVETSPAPRDPAPHDPAPWEPTYTVYPW